MLVHERAACAHGPPPQDSAVLDEVALETGLHITLWMDINLTCCHMTDLTCCYMTHLTVWGSIMRSKRNVGWPAQANRVPVGVNRLHDVPVAMTARDVIVTNAGLIETRPCDGGPFPTIGGAPDHIAGC